MTALPQAALPLLRPRRAKKVLYGRKQRQDHNGAWGELLPGSFDSVGLALRFIGGLGVRTDLETGLLWMRHRWYDASSQRFISRDPIGLSGGANLYEYALSRPLTFVDFLGLDPSISSSWVHEYNRVMTKQYRLPLDERFDPMLEYSRKLRCRMRESFDLMMDFVRDVRPDLSPYAEGVRSSKIGMGASLYGLIHNVSGQTTQILGFRTNIVLSPWTLDSDYSVEFTAMTLLHEGVHAQRSLLWNLSNPKYKEVEAHSLIDDEVLKQIEDYAVKWKVRRKKEKRECCD